MEEFQILVETTTPNTLKLGYGTVRENVVILGNSIVLDYP